MDWEILNWDSDFFGFKTAKISSPRLDLEKLQKVLDRLRSEKVILAYWPSDSLDSASQKAAAGTGGFLADEKTTYRVNLSAIEEKSVVPRDEIGPYGGIEAGEELENLALISGHYSRFNHDPKIPKGKFQELYRLWISKSVQKILAEEVLVFRVQGKAAGMVTLGHHGEKGDIGLLAVHPSAAGKGVGTALVRSAQGWFIKRGYRTGQVVTQGKNAPACRLYEKCGYQVEKVENFYHFWLGRP